MHFLFIVHFLFKSDCEDIVIQLIPALHDALHELWVPLLLSCKQLVKDFMNT